MAVGACIFLPFYGCNTQCDVFYACRNSVCPGTSSSLLPHTCRILTLPAGIHLADAETWLACANVAAAFDVLSPIKDGKPVLPSGKFIEGTIMYVLLTKLFMRVLVCRGRIY